MGLFGFVWNIGKHVIAKEVEASEKIKQEIEEDNPGFEGLDVRYDNGVVSLSGKAACAEAMENAVLMAGNVKGVEEVKVDGLEAPPQTATVDFYTSESGDTLSAIAKRVYSDANAYGQIVEANREVIKNADKIFPGQNIRIPKAVA